jgi:hypothetical protein
MATDREFVQAQEQLDREIEGEIDRAQQDAELDHNIDQLTADLDAQQKRRAIMMREAESTPCNCGSGYSLADCPCNSLDGHDPHEFD